MLERNTLSDPMAQAEAGGPTYQVQASLLLRALLFLMDREAQAPQQGVRPRSPKFPVEIPAKTSEQMVEVTRHLGS